MTTLPSSAHPRPQKQRLINPVVFFAPLQIRTKHEKIQEKIYVMKDQTSQILQEQEHDLLRAFRAR